MNTDELTFTRFFYAVAYHPEWALDDPEFPVLQSLRPLMTNALEHLAYEYPQGNGLADFGDGELWESRRETMSYFLGVLLALLSGSDVPEGPFPGIFPREPDVERLREALDSGVFEDEDAGTLDRRELAFGIVLHVVRRAMELKTGRRA